MTTRLRSGLGRHERRFLRRLRSLFVLFPRNERRRMLELARSNLEDRPTAERWDVLVSDLGRPEDYARQLVHDERALPQPAAWRRVAARFPSPWVLALAVIVTAAVGAGAGAYRDWYTHRPDFSEGCLSVEAVDDLPIEASQAMGFREYHVTYVDGAEFELPICIEASETVEVLEVGFPELDEFGPVEHLASTSQPAYTLVDEPAPTRAPFAPYVLGGGDADAQRRHRPQIVWHRFRFEGCVADLGADSIGSNFTVQAPVVTYRYRGRTHTRTLERTVLVNLRTDREDCPGAPPLPESGAADRPGGE